MFEFTPNTTDGNDKEKVNISAWKPFVFVLNVP